MTVLPESTPDAVTATGTRLVVVLLMPNWPSLLLPQVATVPSEQSAMLWWSPAEMATTVLPESAPVVVTATGTLLSVVVLLPNWPM